MSLNVAAVNTRAEQALIKNESNPEESRQIYLEEILDWTDNYTENMLQESSSQEAKDALSSIVQLWIAYCTMEISLRQFKKAVKIFEDAISDSVASRSAAIYLAYVDYCSTRGKQANAQKVYIKGLSAGLIQEEADKLWANFLPFIQTHGSPDLTMIQLFEAVKSEAAVDSITPPGSGAIIPLIDTSVISTLVHPTHDDIVTSVVNSDQHTIVSNTNKNIIDEVFSSPMVLQEPVVVAEFKSDDLTLSSSFNGSGLVIASEEPIIKQEKITSSLLSDSSVISSEPLLEIKKETEIFSTDDSLKMDIEVIDETMFIDHINANVSNILDVDKTIPIVSNTINSTVNNIVNSTINSIGNIADMSLNPSGAGDDLDSVVGLTPEQVILMYRNRPPILFSAPNKEPTVYGLSTLSDEEIVELETFLNVKLLDVKYGNRSSPCDEYLDLIEGLWTAQALKERHFDSWFTDLKKLHEKERRDLNRLCEEKEKEAVGVALVESVKEKNIADIKRFQSRCSVQKEVLHAVVNKTIFSLLIDQQTSLVAAGFPHFSSSVIDRIHSAIATLRTDTGAISVPSTDGGQSASIFDSTLLEELAYQRKIMCALLSLRVNLIPPSEASGGRLGDNMNKRNMQSSSSSRTDYYSQDAKLQRKAKRRKIYSADGNVELQFDDRRVRQDRSISGGRGRGDSRGRGDNRSDRGGYGDNRSGGRGGGIGSEVRAGRGYQGPEHLRRGPRRVEIGGRGRNIGNDRIGGGGGGGGDNRVDNRDQQNFDNRDQRVIQDQRVQPSISSSINIPTMPVFSVNKVEEPAPLSLLQKLASMIQKAKK